MGRNRLLSFIPWVFWISACFAVPIWVSTLQAHWDFDVYARAAHSLHIGHDPYMDGIAEQERLHRDGQPPSDDNVSYSYVYPPVTLPLLRLLGGLPHWGVLAYWLLYVAAVLAQIWVCMKAGVAQERYFLALFAPAAAFFPGLAQTATILSGNIAYILYGMVLLAAYFGWRRGNWYWFYAAVLLTACFKPPYLTLLAIPVLSARKQWLPAGITGAAGVCIFAIQPLLWPDYYHHFLRAVAMQFSYNSDFGSSPAGILGLVLFLEHMPYCSATWIFYLAYAVPLFALLVYLSRRYFEGTFTFEQWMPILLCGTILLNPRLIEYDLAPVTVPMALLVFRHILSSSNRLRHALLTIVLFIAANYAAYSSFYAARWTECLVLLAVFSTGSWRLLAQLRESSVVESESVEPVEAMA